MQDPNEILQHLRSSKFLVATRSNGYVCPGTMHITDFDSAIGSQHIWSWSSGLWFRLGIYRMEEGGGFTNVHRQIRKLFKSGLIELVNSEKLDYRGQPYKTLRVKENV